MQGGFVGFGVRAAREFKFDSGRARYLWQDYDTHYDASEPPGESGEPENWDPAGPPRYTDYEGDSAYLDGTLSGPDGAGNFNMVGETRYFGGAGQQSLDSQGAVASRKYLHGDLIDSNVMTTDQAGTAVATTAYTAFGEAISWHAGAASPSLPDDPEVLGTRYQYAGAWGYEAPTNIDYTGGGGGGGSGTAPYSEGPGLTLRGVNPNLPPITLSHVGARWYQPAVGRFVQRDPIGVLGGVNYYGYVLNNPQAFVDPAGLDRWSVNRFGHGGCVYGSPKRGYTEIGIKMNVAWDDRWWHWPKDIVENVINGGLCATVGGFGKVYKISVSRPAGDADIPTSEDEDDVLDKQYSDGETVYYNLWFRNCNTWVAQKQGVGTGH